MSGCLIEGLATTEALSSVFSDASVVQAMLDFEIALALAEARAGVFQATAAKAIEESARAQEFNVEDLARQTLRAGTPAIPFVRMLTAKVRAADPAAAGYVHWGATS